MDGVSRIRDDDSGISLIELIIYVLLVALLSIPIVMVLVNSWQTQEDVVSVTEATNRGQLVTSTIERAMRNARDFEVLDGNADGEGSVLAVWTTLGGNLECQGFVLADGVARMSTSDTLLADASTWPEWQEGVVQQTGNPYFNAHTGGVTFAFEIGTESAPVKFTGTGEMRSETEAGSPCWP